MLEVDAAENAQHGRGRGVGHGLGVMRLCPRLGRCVMALHTSGVVDQAQRKRVRRNPRVNAIPLRPEHTDKNGDEGERQTAHDQRHGAALRGGLRRSRRWRWRRTTLGSVPAHDARSASHA